MILNNRLAIIVPSTTDFDQPADDLHYEWIGRAQQWFVEQFGGFTSINGFGGYKDGNGNVVTEKVVVIYAGASDLSKVDALRAFARKMRLAMGQDSVAIEINNAIELVS